MGEIVVDSGRLDIEGARVLASARLCEPLCRRTTAVPVWGIVLDAEAEVGIDRVIVGATLAPPVPLVAGRKDRVRQFAGGLTSARPGPHHFVRGHTLHHRPGPAPRQIGAAPAPTCGARMGFGNELGGSNLWIAADGAELGYVDGCATLLQAGGGSVRSAHGGRGPSFPRSSRGSPPSQRCRLAYSAEGLPR